MNNWFELKSHCVSYVAREIARPRVQASKRTDIKPLDEWAELQHVAVPEAIEKINAMSNMELLDLISEIAGSHA